MVKAININHKTIFIKLPLYFNFIRLIRLAVRGLINNSLAKLALLGIVFL